KGVHKAEETPTPVLTLKCRTASHIIIAVLLVIVVMVQGGFLNAYFLIWMPNNIYFYLFFIPDVACACLFMVSMMLSFQHLVRIHYGQSSKTLDAMFPVKVNRRFSVYYFGLFPLSYISWIFYTSILLTKIIMFLYF
ncbi:Uncharacterized protein GBIM_20974, partial [Gryllus bimaculatus]